MADIDLLVVEQHAVDGLDSTISGLGGLVVNKAIALGAALLIGGDLARQNSAEGGKRIMEGLIVDLLVQVLDEDVALTGLAKGRVTLGPHDTAKQKRGSNHFP